MGLRQALKRGSDFTHRGGKRCGHLRYCRRSALADEMSIDGLAQTGVERVAAVGIKEGAHVFKSLADEVDSYAQFQIRPRAVGRIDGSFECNPESQAGPIS